MKKVAVLYFTVIVVLITFFSRFDEMLLKPLTTGEAFLDGQPYIMIGDVVLTQPSSTVIVYVLGLFIILLGVRFLKLKEDHQSRKWWGWSMILWGIGTIFAGTSYQAFGYELKCVGYEYCLFTDWWEIMYLLMTAVSICMMVIGMAYCVADGKVRDVMIKVAYVSAPLYALVLTVGSLVPVQVLVTYELFNVFFMPHFIVFIIFNIRNFRKDGDLLNKRFIITWILFLLVNVSYYVYYWFGFSEWLLETTGIWFNQNDVLHVAILLWFAYIWWALPRKMKDRG